MTKNVPPPKKKTRPTKKIDHINNLKKKIFIEVKIGPHKELTHKRGEVAHLWGE